MTNIGTRIKERRVELGMSQDELAEKMGYKSRSTIAKIESGVNDVAQTNIVKFSEVLNTSIAYLMGWEERIGEDPIGEANKLADRIIGLGIKEDDKDMQILIEGYKKLDASSKKHLLAYISFLTEKGRD